MLCPCEPAVADARGVREGTENSLCRWQKQHRMRESEIQIGNSW
jgi:hypothetical protein